MKIEQHTWIADLSKLLVDVQDHINELITEKAKDGWLLVNIFSTSAGEIFLFQRMVS